MFREVFPWDSPRPPDLPLSVPHGPRSIPCTPQEGTRRCVSARPDLVQCKAWAPSLNHPPRPGARAWVPGTGWPLSPPRPPGRPHQELRSQPCFLGFQPRVALSQLSRFQPVISPFPISPISSLLCFNLTPVAPETGFVPKLLHQI